MRARRHDPIIAAIIAEIDTVDRTLVRLRAPASAVDDLRQMVLIRAWKAAVRGRVAWQRPRALCAFLATAIAQREGVPTMTIYTRLRLATKDFDAVLRREDAAIYVRRKK